MIVTGTYEKGPDGRGLLTKEEKMCRTITASELKNKTDIELSALFRKVSEKITSNEAGSRKQRALLASLVNISRAMRSRHLRRNFPRPKLPGF